MAHSHICPIRVRPEALRSEPSKRASRPYDLRASRCSRSYRLTVSASEGQDDKATLADNLSNFVKSRDSASKKAAAKATGFLGKAPTEAERRAEIAKQVARLEDAMKRGEVPEFYGPKTTGDKIPWKLAHTYLTACKQESVSCMRAARLEAGGATLLDVSPSDLFAKGHAKGAINVPLFESMQNRSPNKAFVNLLFKIGFGRAATERDLNFIDQVSDICSKSDSILVMCNRGGTLDTMIRLEGRAPYADPDRRYGIESRSLKAVFELRRAGFSNVFHVDGGFYARKGWSTMADEMGLEVEVQD
ncbi:hypothetical protein CYMTET_41644 [Cymbomonas tetramitiformis]|uniref:Rhodanese domain-containing protein n=1 Tax=Cymbomonas tetramitiformis TaxID=36881 RepID=A0AAE0C7N3_9CHLO|nr:hypothetical protein CYMTET_41644 [Cymbomonas tetramitiformis]